MQAADGPQHGGVAMRRASRGVPYQGEQRDIQVVLQNHLERGRALDTLVQRVVSDVEVQRPALDYLANNADIPPEVRSLASGYYLLTTALLQYLASIRSGLDTWTGAVESSLDAAQTANDHALIDPRPWAMGRLGAEFRVLNNYGRESLHVYADIEAFLRAHAHYLVPPQADSGRTFSCDARTGQGPPDDGPGNASGGVLAATRGVPQAIQSYQTAYEAGWDTQARYFQMGHPIAHNRNHRRYQFVDRSYVDTQAHQPALSTSTASDLAVVGTGAMGAVAGGVARGTVGALVGAGAGVALAAWGRPYDAAWQGYSARYYPAAPGARKVWGFREFYGWRKSPGVTSAVRIGGSHDPADFPNFADSPDAYSWWRWRHGHAAPRSATFDGCGQAQRRQAAEEHAVQQGSTDLLTQAMGGFSPKTESASPRFGFSRISVAGSDGPGLLLLRRLPESDGG